MTAPVIDLASHRRNRERTERADCPVCRPGSACYPHQLEALAGRLRDARVDALLVAVTVLDDALDVLDGITHECLAPRTRARVGTPNNPNKEHA